MTSVVQRSLPSLSCHLRVWSLPSTYTCLPFLRYLETTSALLPQETTECHSVRSCFWPLRSW